MCAGLIDGAVEMREALRAEGAQLWALSNFAADSWERAVRLYPELTEFHGLVISGREKCVKPDARIYEILEERTGASGAELFFLDDREANIAAARARGWGGHIFTDTKTAIPALREAGFRLG